jgi:hypothetical protein
MGKQVQDLSSRGCQAAWSFSPSSAIGTTITGILTITGCVLEPGQAYSVENVGGVWADVTGRYADFAIFKNSLSTQIGAFYRTPQVGANGKQTNCYGKVYVKNTQASANTFDMILSMVADAGTVVHDAAAGRPRSLVVTQLGPASAYPFAFDVP